jgi:hypothetical protein
LGQEVSIGEPADTTHAAVEESEGNDQVVRGGKRRIEPVKACRESCLE